MTKSERGHEPDEETAKSIVPISWDDVSRRGANGRMVPSPPSYRQVFGSRVKCKIDLLDALDASLGSFAKVQPHRAERAVAAYLAESIAFSVSPPKSENTGLLHVLPDAFHAV